jgi:glucose dehydrogenase
MSFRLAVIISGAALLLGIQGLAVKAQQGTRTKLDYSAISVPMTYRGKNGKQYVAVTSSGGAGITDPNPNNTESLYVYTLP